MQYPTSQGCRIQLLMSTEDGGVTKDFMPVYDYTSEMQKTQLTKILIKTCIAIQSDGTSQEKFIIKPHSDSFEPLQEKFHLENEMKKCI